MTSDGLNSDGIPGSNELLNMHESCDSPQAEKLNVKSENQSCNFETTSEMEEAKIYSESENATPVETFSSRPKKPLTPYLCFLKDIREHVCLQNPELTFGEIGRLIGILWKELKAEERKKYEEMAAADKARYFIEKSNYKESGPKRIFRRRKKDPEAPKKPKSAYMFFVGTNRWKIAEENPSATFKEIGNLMGIKWKELVDKKPYEDLAKKDKARYQLEKMEYEYEISLKNQI